MGMLYDVVVQTLRGKVGVDLRYEAPFVVLILWCRQVGVPGDRDG